MKTFTHALAVFAAGAVAFAAVLGAHIITTPLLSGSEGSDAPDDPSSSGGAHVPAPGLLDVAMLGRWQAPEPANQDAFVEFTEYGLWFASDGCNGLNGTWSASEDGTLGIDGTEAMTMIACDNEPIPTAVRYAVSAEVTPDGELVLTNADDEETTLVQARRGSLSLAGRWVPDQSTGGAYVEFSADGRWEGSDGCNAASGSWELSAADVGSGSDSADIYFPSYGRLVIGDLSAMTEMACEDLDSVNLPIELAGATGLEFADQNRVTLLITQPDSEEWEHLQLQRADEGPPVIVVP